MFARTGSRCVYCGRDLGSTYEAWLDISIDHVVPVTMIALAGFPEIWVHDIAKLVTCCRACNEFLNAYRVDDPVPASAAEFLQLVGKHVALKRAAAKKRHDAEQAWYAQWQLEAKT